MIVITKGETNTFTLTLREKADLNLPLNWEIVFELEQAPEDYVYTLNLPDISQNVNYQTFELEEGVDVTFPFTGDYKYKVFQVGNTARIETGKMRVIDPEVTATYFTADNSRKVYAKD